jgi:hyperosmotically inducible protein
MKTKICALLLVFLVLASVGLSKDAITDDMIYDKVRIKLAEDQVVKGGAIQVDVKNGVVTLAGAVEQDKQKDRAAKLAKGVKGVKDVVNNITLRSKDAGK